MAERRIGAELARRVAALPPGKRRRWAAAMGAAGERGLRHAWPFWARDEQLAPAGAWRVWLLLAGRGFGKTRSGAEWVRGEVEAGRARRVALVAPTAGDARDVMIEGESGLLAVSSPGNRPVYEPSKRRLTWPGGAVATAYSAAEPERLRGPQHDAAWCDELAAWRDPAAWDMLMFGLRLGADPRAVVTTTPKPVRLVRELLQREGRDVAVTRGSTYDNEGNLAPAFLAEIVARYEGTRLGRQELMAELLEDVQGALWTRAAIEAARAAPERVAQGLPEMRRIVVAIDPAVSQGEAADETGIVVAGLGEDRRGYVLADLSGRFAPHDWAGRAVAAYRAYRADRIVAEANNGGDLVAATLRVVDPAAGCRLVRASRGKRARAEPVAALYEQGRVRHWGAFPALEDQMCSFAPGQAGGPSPDRLDALVWALSALMVEPGDAALLDYYREAAGG